MEKLEQIQYNETVKKIFTNPAYAVLYLVASALAGPTIRRKINCCVDNQYKNDWETVGGIVLDMFSHSINFGVPIYLAFYVDMKYGIAALATNAASLAYERRRKNKMSALEQEVMKKTN